MLLCMMATACQIPDSEGNGNRPNTATYVLDGEQKTTEEGVSYALYDRSKKILGDNTYLLTMVYEISLEPDIVLGNSLQINIPKNINNGKHRVKYTELPSKNNIWVRYRENVIDKWTAYDGIIIIEEMGSIGERIRIKFNEIKMSNSCGEERIMTNGYIDIKIGADDVFPTTEGLNDELPGAMDYNENSVIYEIDNKVYACALSDYRLMTLSEENSDTGKPEEIFYMRSICMCKYNASDNSYKKLLTIVAFLPSGEQGKVRVQGEQYMCILLEDVKHTPYKYDDDEIWMPISEAVLYYNKMGNQKGEYIDIKMIEPLEMVYVDMSTGEATLDPSRKKKITYSHIYGEILEDCRPYECL